MENRNTTHIYTLSDPITKMVRYVGKTFDLKQRYYDHTCSSGRMNKRKSWIRSLTKMGLYPVMEVIESIENATDEQWADAERFWISTLRFYGCDLTNMDSGGLGGKRMSEDAKLKMSIHRKTFRHTEESKRKISTKSKAAMTPEARANLSRIFKGRKHTEEVKKFIAAGKIGKPRPEHVRRKLLAHSILAKFKRGCVTPDYQKEIVLSVLGVSI